MKKKDLRCIHRHLITEHPKCFLKGMVKAEFNSDKEWSKETGLPWYTYPEYRIGYLDIETDGLTADFGTMLSWCIKEKDGEIISSVVTREELFGDVYDARLVQDLINEMNKYRILIGYYSDMFDFPYIRTKALHYGLEFPTFGQIYTWDLYFSVRNKLRLSRNSLANVCDYLGIDGKTHVDKNVWRKAKYGDKKSLRLVLDHNASDVIATELLHNKLEFSRKWTRKSI